MTHLKDFIFLVFIIITAPIMSGVISLNCITEQMEEFLEGLSDSVKDFCKKGGDE